MNPRLATLFAATAIASFMAGGLLVPSSCHGRPTTEVHALPPEAARASASLWALRLPDARGKEQAFQQWRGKLVVLNLWATWCHPCRAEMPGFSRLQEKLAGRGVQFVGVALDTPEQVTNYATRMAIRYPLLIGSSDLFPMFSDLGNPHGNVPYTLIFGRDGRLLQTHMGYWPETELETVLTRLS